MVELRYPDMFWKACKLLCPMGACSGLHRGVLMEICPLFVFWGQGWLSRGPESPESRENGVLGPAEVGLGRLNMF